MIGSSSSFQGQEMETVFNQIQIRNQNSEEPLNPLHRPSIIDESFIDLSSNLDSNETPVKNVVKKRRISDDNHEVKKSTLSTGTPNTPNNPSNSIKNDLKRILQSNDSEVAKYYQIKSNSKLVMIQGNCGEAPYRNHPDTIKELNEYFENFKNLNRFQCDENEFNFCMFMREKYPQLIVKLVQDSQIPQVDLLASLKRILFPLGSGLKEFNLDSSLWEGLVEKVSYGHPEAQSSFSAWSCTFWQTKELELLGEAIGKHFLTNYVMRNAAKMILEAALKAQSEVINEDQQEEQQQLPEINLMKIESGTATPKKREKEKISKTSTTATSTTTTSLPTAVASIPKISSFFAKLKKPETVERTSSEYFQPFFVKPDVTVAPINHLRTLKASQGIESCDGESVTEYWQMFKEQSVWIDYEKPKCLCVGYDGRPVRAVLKLLKFDENYRPAYLGTWRKSVPQRVINARRPFGRLEEVDYEYDSDAEWDEGEDPEGESLSDLDDDEDEEDDFGDEEDELSCGNGSEMEFGSNRSDSADSWLVPHGYLSDDEGGVVDEIHPGEVEEASGGSTTVSDKAKPPRKTKFIPKEPVLYGPFISADQVLPQCLQPSTLQIFSSSSSFGFGDPFANYEAVFVGLESSGSSSGNGKKASSFDADKSVFPENLLPSMIQIINYNPSAGMTKLYDEFLLLHGKAVSRRLFESKLNQITTGKLKCEKTGKMRWILKDEHKDNSSTNTTANNNNTIFMQID